MKILRFVCALKNSVGETPTGQPARRRRYLLAVAVLFSLSLSSVSWAATRTVNVGQGGTNFVDQASGNSTTVINVGDTVQWNWVSGTHSTTSGTCSSGCSPDGTWDSTILSAPSGTFSFTFNNVGSFPYYCRVHLSSMTGKVIVNPVVTNTNDSGAGSLRQAILDLNADPDLTTITFNIPGGGVHTIIPLSALPVMTRAGVLDGYTQPGSGPNNPLIELNGAGAGGSANGLSIQAGNSTVRGLVINRFSQNGIVLQSGNNVITGNFIGTNAAGNTSLANGGDGVLISSGEFNNTIGGTTTAARNVISGNGLFGIEIAGLGTNGNLVQGNFIGTDITGSAALANSAGGVDIQSGAANNILGGASAGAGNVISGNSGSNIAISGGGTNGNIVQGNFVGTNAAGTAAVSAIAVNGVLIQSGASNTIGGTAAGAGNLISGNSSTGVTISVGSGNLVEGNLIGTDAAGTGRIANGIGVYIIGGATGNAIGGTIPGAKNVISYNNGDGIHLDGGGTTGNFLQGNFLGTNASGTAGAGPSSGSGVYITGGASNNTIGGTTAAARNIISDYADGILIVNGNSNLIQGNFIGTDVSGNTALGNAGPGVRIAGGGNNIIGGTAAGAGNVISGNLQYGIDLYGGGTSANIVEGNFIGTNSSGAAALGNGSNGVYISVGAANNTIGGVAAGARNIISGNLGHGVAISNTGSNGNAVEGNYIGTDVNGSSALGNFGDGVRVDTGAASNAIGVSLGNLIAFDAKGVVVTGSGSTGNTIEGNAIFSNTGLGIDLNDDGVTPNDSSGHTGPNNFQNYPVLTSAISSGGTTNVTGTLNSTPNTTFHVELFGNMACDASGHGQGLNLLGTSSVTTDGSGNAPLSFSFSTSLIGSGSLSATATDPSGNTSEFSACQQADYALTNVAGRNLHVRLGQPFTFVVASFTDADPSGNAGQFSTTSIDWGDGSAPTSATVVSTGGQNYNVIGSHAYAKVGSWNVTVTINDSGGATATATSKARLWPKALSY